MKVMKGTGTNGYAGNILRVDLSSEDVSCEPTMKYAKEWLGGSGIGQWILYNEVKPWVTPYAPANKLIVGAGPLLGTPGPAASRLSGDSINALTNGVGSSNCDSHFGPGLKFAGYDQIILEGRARKPVYIWITDDHVQIRDATNLWGRTTWETLEAIRHELGDDDVHVLSIGPAGENLVRGTGRAMGRCGLGGVMGSKNLKAVAVRGSGGIRLADAERFMRAVDKARDAFDKAPIVTAIRKFGVPVITTNKQAVGGIPYKNFQYLTLPEDLYKSLDNERLNANYRIRNVSFMGCPYGCGRYFFVNDGQYAGLRSEGFQFEQVADFGGKLAVHDPTFIIKLNAYCNQMGMDVDLVANLREEDIAPFVQALGDAFYADADMMRGAIGQHRSFNLIHLESMFKVDVFVARPRDFDRAQLARRQLHLLSEDPERWAYVASAEDTILAKLEWYRIGGEGSDRQWRDALGVLKVQGLRLDLAYMHQMAAGLGVKDLLERALEESA